MKLRTIALLAALPLLLLSGCGPRELARFGLEGVESFRAEAPAFGSVEGTATVALYNGNKKNVTFGSGRIEILLNGKTIGRVTLVRPVTVAPGYGYAEVPVRVRFPQNGLKSVLELILTGHSGRTGKSGVRIAGTLGIDREGRRVTVRFDRKVGPEMVTLFGKAFIAPGAFQLFR